MGKSAIPEALDLAMNGHRQWNITQGEKKTEAFICPLFLIPKVSITSSKRKDIEIISNFFWELKQDTTSGAFSAQATKEFIDYKDKLKEKYQKTHYLILVGISNDQRGAYFSSSFDSTIKKLLGDNEAEQFKTTNAVRDLVLSL